MKKISMYKFLLALLVIFFVSSSASAQDAGGDIFDTAACNLLTLVLTKDFGALMTVLAGLFAIVSAIAGSFRNAWILVFVSVGIYVYPTIVNEIFSLSCGGAGGGGAGGG